MLGERTNLAHVLLIPFALLAASMASLGASASEEAATPVTVFKSPTCGCCAKWVQYLHDNGFAVTVHDRHDMNPIKEQHGVHPRLRSCHTATVGGYTIEGHVPVADIRRLLTERPAIKGLTAPGMPMMSPGMHSIEPKGYDVLSFDGDGKVEVYSSY